jgi:hypothetical protein
MQSCTVPQFPARRVNQWHDLSVLQLDELNAGELFAIPLHKHLRRRS